MRGILSSPRYEDRLEPLEAADHVFQSYKVRRTLAIPMLDENPEMNPQRLQGKVLRGDTNGSGLGHKLRHEFNFEDFQFQALLAGHGPTLLTNTPPLDITYVYVTGPPVMNYCEWCLSDGTSLLELPRDEGLLLLPGVTDKFYAQAFGQYGAPVTIHVYQYDWR